MSQPLADPDAHCAERDSWCMTVIAEWPFSLLSSSGPLCGDADRDNYREVYVYIPSEPYPLYAVEFIDNSHFDSTRIGEDLVIQCLGDFDRDGFADIAVDSRFSGGTRIFESPDSYSLPTCCVCTVPSGISKTVTSDLDVDSARELVIDYDSRTIVVYECVGDNRYDRKIDIYPGGVPAQTLDMDRDGTPELAVGRRGGCVAFYEAVGNDSLVFRDTVRVVETVQNSSFHFMAAARDMDRDGRPELIAPCLDYNQGLLRLAVLESPCDDSFAVVWSEVLPGGWPWTVAVGDIEGDSTLEFAFTCGRYLRLYRCVGDDQYQCFWQTDSANVDAVLYDINSDGRDELIHNRRGVGDMVIRAWLPVGVEERVAEALQRVNVVPSVARRNGAISVTGLPPSAAVEIADVTGRVVTTLASGVWHPASSGAGTFFLRIRLANQSVVRKVLVVE